MFGRVGTQLTNPESRERQFEGEKEKKKNPVNVDPSPLGAPATGTSAPVMQTSPRCSGRGTGTSAPATRTSLLVVFWSPCLWLGMVLDAEDSGNARNRPIGRWLQLQRHRRRRSRSSSSTAPCSGGSCGGIRCRQRRNSRSRHPSTAWPPRLVVWFCRHSP